MGQFTTVPTIHAPRTKFNLSFDHKMSGSVGNLYPCYVQEIYPGDTFNCTASIVTRLTSAYLRPVMDNLFLDMYFFFVPHRLCFEDFPSVLGENKRSAWAQTTPVNVPEIPAGIVQPRTVGDYLGLPLNSVPKGCSVLPFRAFALIYDQWFRDENLIQPMLVQTGAIGQTEAYNANNWSPSNYFGNVPRVSKFHDVFTSSLPSTQKGADISVPLGEWAKVVPRGDGSSSKSFDFDTLDKVNIGTSGTYKSNVLFGGASSQASVPKFRLSAYDNSVQEPDAGVVTSWNLWADLANAEGGLNVPDLRYAFQLQRILERSARSGTRYPEYILSAFGVQSPDARLQRAEYLGGKRMPLSVQQVAQTVRTEDNDGLGALGAFSLSNGKCGYTKGFVEHGYVIGVMCVRQHHTYQQGIPKHFQRTSRFDFYDPALANISEQPVYTTEIYANGFRSLDERVFGYQEAWYDLRQRSSSVAGDMRSASDTPLDIWHYADLYANFPTLNKGFIEEIPDYVDRTIAVSSQELDQFIFDIYYDQSAIRCLPAYSVPGLIDHN